MTWVQTNHITTARQAVAIGAPLVLSWVIRQLVVAPDTHAATVRSLALLKEAVAVSASEPFGKSVPTVELSKILTDVDAKYQAGDPKIGPNAGAVDVGTVVVVIVSALVALFVWTVWIAPHVH